VNEAPLVISKQAQVSEPNVSEIKKMIPKQKIESTLLIPKVVAKKA
jgi:hypothetical protein